MNLARLAELSAELDRAEINVERRDAAQYSRPALTVTAGKNGPTFAGYVLKWGTFADLGTYLETVERGAFAKALAHIDNLFMVLDHEKRCTSVLGSTGTGTLQLKEDDIGVAFVCVASDTQAARDVAAILNGKDEEARSKLGVSFAFISNPKKEKWSKTPDGRRLRTIGEFDALDDVSIVVDPAYKSSVVSVIPGSGQRSVDYLQRELELADLEHKFRMAEYRDGDYQLSDDAAQGRIASASSTADKAAALGAMETGEQGRDEDGKYHDGSPESNLLAAVGRARKGEAAHGAASDECRAAVACGKDPAGMDAQTARLAWMEARDKHRQAIDECRAAADAFVADHQAKYDSPDYANPAATITNPTALTC